MKPSFAAALLTLYSGGKVTRNVRLATLKTVISYPVVHMKVVKSRRYRYLSIIMSLSIRICERPTLEQTQKSPTFMSTVLEVNPTEVLYQIMV